MIRAYLLHADLFLSDASLKLWVGPDAFEALGLRHLELQKMLTALTTAVFLAVAVARQPFSDWQDAVIDGLWCGGGSL